MPLDPNAESRYYEGREFDPGHNRAVRAHYLQFIEGAGLLVELGCGRGEFLELASAAAGKVKGVDSDPGMVEDARARGIEIEQCEAIDWARTTSDRPDAVFAAHLIEHLMVDEAFELLQALAAIIPPAGRVVLVTPNPACLAMLTADFWSDPTHRRLYTIELISFLLRETGFDVVEAQGNPNDVPGPPPALLAAETLDGWSSLRDELGDASRVPHIYGRATERFDSQLIDTVRALAQEVGRLRHVVGALDDRIDAIRHQLHHVLQRHNEMLSFLYPANEIYVVGERRRAP
jgi:SAM-dependent methyltransferase